MDHGTPEDIRQELLVLRELHEEFPWMIICRGRGEKGHGRRAGLESSIA